MPAADIEDALVAFLKATPQVTALIGEANNARIYPEASPQDELRDHLTYQVISDVRKGHLGGQILLSVARIQIDCYSKANVPAKALQLAVMRAKGGTNGRELDGFEGQWDGVKVYRCIVEDRRGDPIPPTHGEESPLRRRTMDLLVSYDIP
jgi:uncharacterized protein DUF3168